MLTSKTTNRTPGHPRRGDPLGRPFQSYNSLRKSSREITLAYLIPKAAMKAPWTWAAGMLRPHRNVIARSALRKFSITMPHHACPHCGFYKGRLVIPKAAE